MGSGGFGRIPAGFGRVRPGSGGSMFKYVREWGEINFDQFRVEVG